MISETTIQRTEGVTKRGIHFRVSSSDTSRSPLLLVMGYGGNLCMWPDQLINALSQKYKVITFDNRGTGQSIKPLEKEQYSAGLMAEDAHSIVEQLQLFKFNILGFSLGGCIALEYANAYQSRLQSLFLMSTTAGGKLHIKPKRDKSDLLAKPQGDTLWDEYVAVWKLCMSEASFNRHLSTLKAMFENSCPYLTPPEALQGHMNVLEHFDGSKYLQSLTIPTTVLAGMEDRLLPIQNSQAIAERMPQAKLVLIPDCQHYPHVEHEDVVLKEIFSLCN